MLEARIPLLCCSLLWWCQLHVSWHGRGCCSVTAVWNVLLSTIPSQALLSSLQLAQECWTTQWSRHSRLQSSLSQKPSGTLHKVLEGEMGFGGDCAWQQVREVLALVVAMRNQWHVKRGTVRVRSDSVCALTRVLKLRGGSLGLRALTREAAHDASAACYRPVVAEHIPGVANHLADLLGRRRQPSDESVWFLPPELSFARKRTVLPLSPPRCWTRKPPRLLQQR